jgi:Putative auto-transporter adhesin, head GIN domain
MKKTTILIAAVLFTAIFNFSSGKNPGDPLTGKDPLFISTLVVNADVTVVLVNDNVTLEVDGRNSFKKLVILEKKGDTLVISSLKDKYLNDDVTIYVPANQLSNIQVNSKAHVRSLFALRIPKLDVTINGACDVSISNIGEVNVMGTDNYSYEENRKVRPIPASILRRKE